MTNLEYLRTMSAEQITKWLYEWWLPKGQYAWNSSSGALTMLLNKEYGDNETEMLFGDSSAEPIVIRSRTLMPTKDFKEWAKRIREVNPNAVIIPCDAEVASDEVEQREWVVDEYGIYHCPICHAINNTVYKSFCPNCGARMKAKVLSTDAVHGWIPLLYDDNGLGTNFPYERDGEWVIVTDGKTISVERIKKDVYDHFFPNGRWFELEDVIAWMPLPQPYKGGDDE